MFRNLFGIRAGVVALGAAGLLGGAVAPAAAWPTPLTGEDIRFLDATRGNFAAADDDTLLTAGKLACRLLYTGHGRQAAVDSIAAQFGANAGQAANLVGAARSSYCTQAPG